MNPSLMLRVFVVSLVSISGSRECLAQAEPEVKPAKVPLEQVPDRLKKLDSDWTQEVKAAEKTVGEEQASKRITEAAAQSLLWTLKNAASLMFDSRSLGGARIPAENAALTNAFRKLEALQEVLQSERTTLLENLYKEVRERSSKLLQGPSSVAEVDKLIDTLGVVDIGLKSRGSSATYDPSNKISNAIAFLERLRRLIEAEAGGDVTVLASAMTDLRMNYGGQDSISEVEKRKRLDLATKPYRTAEQETQKKLESALESRLPVAELSKALAEYGAAAEKLRTLQSTEGRVPKDLVPAYRNVIELLRAAESGDGMNVKVLMDRARSSSMELGTEGQAHLAQLITKLERDIEEQEKKRGQADVEETRKKLAAATEAADVDSVLRDLRVSTTANRQGTDPNNFNALSNTLSMIANGWRTNSLQLLQNAESGYGGSRTSFEPEIASLKNRAIRDVTARVLRTPELIQAPLADKPLNEAIETLCDQLVEKREWRRLLQILESRQGAGVEGRYAGASSIGVDTVTALQAYLVAQNFELAEMWLDAADSYRTVLRSTSRRAPIADAAERLKKLIKEHPEAERKAEPASAAKPQ